MTQKISNNMRAFLDTIAISEGTKGKGDDGYNVLVGGGLFYGYEDHPNIIVSLNNLGIKSSAAGRYQILGWIFKFYKKTMKLPDFGPESQDRVAMQLIRECGAINDVEAGRITIAIEKCASRWASFPGAGYGQHEHKMNYLLTAFKQQGGILS